MRRRRLPPRRPLIRPIRGIPQRRPIPPKLIEANKLFDAGEYKKAAVLFAELAQKAENRNIPQAPNLYLRSGAAWLKENQAGKAEEMIKKGLGLFICRQRWMQLNKSTALTVEKLKEAGHDDLAKKIETWVKSQIPEDIDLEKYKTDLPFKPNSSTVKLPSTCSNCGGPVNPKEIEWYDSANPICSFCGTVLNDE